MQEGERRWGLKISTSGGNDPHLLHVVKYLLYCQGDDPWLRLSAHHGERLPTGGLAIRKHSPYTHTHTHIHTIQKWDRGVKGLCGAVFLLTIEALHHRVYNGECDGSIELVCGGRLTKHMVWRERECVCACMYVCEYSASLHARIYQIRSQHSLGWLELWHSLPARPISPRSSPWREQRRVCQLTG